MGRVRMGLMRRRHAPWSISRCATTTSPLLLHRSIRVPAPERNVAPVHSILCLYARTLSQGMLESRDEEEDEEADGQLTPGADTNRSHPSGGGKAIDPEALDDQKMAWLQAEGSERPKGVPLRCLLCKNKLLISSGALFYTTQATPLLVNRQRLVI